MAKKTETRPERDDSLASCGELQKAIAAKGQRVGVHALADLSPSDRAILWQWSEDDAAKDFPSIIAARLNGQVTEGVASTKKNGMSKTQRAYLAIDEEIIALAPQVRAAEIEVEDDKKTLAQSRKTYEKLVKQLTALNMKLVDASNGQLQNDLPFPAGDPDVPQEVRSGADKPKGTPGLAQVGADIAALRGTDVAEYVKRKTKSGIKLTAKIVGKITEAGIQTVGELHDAMRDGEILDKVDLTLKEATRIREFIADFPLPAGKVRK